MRHVISALVMNEPGVLAGVANMFSARGFNIDSLVVAEAYVGKNLVMKRFHARARGRASRVEKPFSEITIVVREVGEAA